MRSIRFAKTGPLGRDRGGIPVLIEKPNRKLRRLTAKQARQAAQMERAPRQAPNPKQLMTHKSVRK